MPAPSGQSCDIEMTEHFIPRGNAGSIATAQAIVALAQDGLNNPDLRRFAVSVSPRSLDHILRGLWHIVPDGTHEVVRSIPRLMTDFQTRRKFFGDCDDAAVLSAALMMLWAGSVQHASLDLLRTPQSPTFEHVFVTAVDSYGAFRIDPTAPRNASYTNWERLATPLF
jgi:hypothetical protein